MAEKRMFTQKIIDSDAFLDMPLSTQALYFHLNMRADDDGFINNPKKIQRMIGASVDDLKLLIAKRFVLCFESGVIVIKHWRMHNTLRKDRYNPTQYQDEYALLTVKDNNSYTDKALPEISTAETEWQPNGNQMATERQHSIEEYSIDSDKYSIEEDKGTAKGKDYEEITKLFNSLCPSLPSIKTISDARKKAIQSRCRKYSLEDFMTVFKKAEASAFLKGDNERKWNATFDWLIKEANFVKVLEGNFDNKPDKPKYKGQNFPQRQYEYDALQRMLRSDPGEKVEDDPELLAEAEALKKELAEIYGKGEQNGS